MQPLSTAVISTEDSTDVIYTKDVQKKWHNKLIKMLIGSGVTHIKAILALQEV